MIGINEDMRIEGGIVGDASDGQIGIRESTVATLNR